MEGESKNDRVGTVHWFAPPLPPNRACGFPAHGSPVGGFTSKRIDKRVRGLRYARATTVRQSRPVDTIDDRPHASLDPLFEGCQHARNPRQRFGPRDHDPVGPCPRPWALFSRLCGTCGTGLRSRQCYASAFLRPFAPHPLQALRRSYGRSDFCPALAPRTDLPVSRTQPSDHSASNHPTASCRRFCTLPLTATGGSATAAAGSRLRHFPASSPSTSGRIEFVILRTSHSPPVASHPASRRRSYARLRGRRAYAPKRTCTSLIVCALRRTGMCALGAATAMHLILPRRDGASRCGCGGALRIIT